VTIPTFDQLATLEPGLKRLESECRLYKGRDRLAYWYGYFRCLGPGVKPRLVGLVGWTRRPLGMPRDADAEALLKSSSAYDVAYDHLIGLLMRRRKAAGGAR
jgi:hypothetical protein